MRSEEKKITETTAAEVNFSILEYMYRDASNYKAFGELLLTGSHSKNDFESIRASCESDLSFVAEQLGIPSLCHILYEHGGGPNEDDHVFHEVIQLREALPSDLALNPWGNVSALVDEFLRARANWNYSLSPNWPGDPWTWWKPAPRVCPP